MGIFLKHLWLIPNILKWQDCKMFTTLVPSRTRSRSSHLRSSVKKDVLKNLRNFTGKHLCWSLFLQLYLKETPTQVFLAKFAKFLRTPIWRIFANDGFWIRVPKVPFRFFDKFRNKVLIFVSILKLRQKTSK